MDTDTPRRIGQFRAPLPSKPANDNLHSEVHEFIDETRKEFKDTLPFGRWLSACKGFTAHDLYIIRGSVRESKAKSPAKLFFYKLREARKASKQKKV